MKRRQRHRRLLFWSLALTTFLFSGLQLAIIATSHAPGSRDVIINEFLAANQSGLTDEDGHYSDWIEIYNPTDHPINLGGWALTDDPHQPDKWLFPDLTLDGGAYLLVFASGKDRTSTGRAIPLHTNFRLNQDGEFLGLYNIHQSRFGATATFEFGEQFADMAYGRYGSGAYGYLEQPTPGRANNGTRAWQAMTEPVDFSIERGFYETAFTVVLSSPTPGATIRYTLNGSEPDESSGLLYSQPIPVEHTNLLRARAFHPDNLPSSIETHTYLFLTDVLRQPPNPSGFPSTWGQHPIDFAGYKAGQPVVADYEVDPTLVNDARYADQIEAALRAIPSLSIVTDVQSFYLYANPRERGPGWERPASVELIYPDEERTGFHINAGIQIQGGAGRWEFMPKHSFRLLFKQIYGPSRLTYPLFPDSPVEEFNTLTLRAGVDRSYAGHPEATDHRLTTYTRDEWLRASQIAISEVGSHGLFVHLYLNGLYWGLYNVVERPDAAFAAAYLGGEEAEWHIINHRGTLSGDTTRFKTLLALAEADDLADPEKYAEAQTYLDVVHFVDYLILNWYAGTKDWPENNWYAGLRNPDGRLKHFVWDGEESWQAGAEIHLGQDDLAGVPNSIKILFEALIKNPDFRLLLADRLHKHLFNDGPLTEDRAQARWQALNAPLEQAIIGESMRWGDARYEPPITQADWLAARNDVLNQMKGNVARLIRLARQKGYYPDIEPPAFNQHGGPVHDDFVVTLTAAEGEIYYTTDGSDPRTPVKGNIAATARRYRGPLPVTTTTPIKARALAGTVWSALSEAAFVSDTRPPKIYITEVMYHPPDGSDYEFIELTNYGPTTIDLAGATFEAGIRFTFPFDTPPLAPNQTLVLAADETAFRQKYPAVNLAGIYEGQLANQGETVTLVSSTGAHLAGVSYDDEQTWPISPDGWGDSLVWSGNDGDPDDPANWQASLYVGGSPGVAGP